MVVSCDKPVEQLLHGGEHLKANRFPREFRWTCLLLIRNNSELLMELNERKKMEKGK